MELLRILWSSIRQLIPWNQRHPMSRERAENGVLGSQSQMSCPALGTPVLERLHAFPLGSCSLGLALLSCMPPFSAFSCSFQAHVKASSCKGSCLVLPVTTELFLLWLLVDGYLYVGTSHIPLISGSFPELQFPPPALPPSTVLSHPSIFGFSLSLSVFFSLSAHKIVQSSLVLKCPMDATFLSYVSFLSNPGLLKASSTCTVFASSHLIY